MEVIQRAEGDLKGKILKEQGTDKHRLKQDVEKLKQWLDKQPHLPTNIGVELLECFAVGCKSVEDAKIRIDRYFSVRNHVKEFYCDRDPAKLHPDIVQQFFLPGYTDDGRLVYIIRVPENCDLKNFSNLIVSKRQIMLTDYILNGGYISTGMIVIYDTSGMSAALLQNFSLPVFLRANKAVQDNYPIQVKKLFLVNCNSFVVNMFETIIKPLVKKKFASRVSILKAGGEKELLEYIPETILPSDMGGKGATCQQLHDAYLKLLLDNRDWLISTETQRSDETKRLIKTKFDFEENFGIDGNFRRLAID